MRLIILAALIHIIPVPAPDPLATPPTSLDDARDYCEAYGGHWNTYTNETGDASWFQCDETDDPIDCTNHPFCPDDEDDGSCGCEDTQ